MGGKEGGREGGLRTREGHFVGGVKEGEGEEGEDGGGGGSEAAHLVRDPAWRERGREGGREGEINGGIEGRG